MLREKLHRPKERKRFEYSSSLFFPNSPHHFPSLSPVIPISRTHACMNGVVIILAIRNVAIRADDEREERRESSLLRFKSSSDRGTGPLRGIVGPSRLILGFGRPGESRAARHSSRELPAKPKKPAIGNDQRLPSNRRWFQDRPHTKGNISRGCGARVPSERINQQPGVIRDYYFYRNAPLASSRFA